jgi:hypothetical protein
VLTAVPTAECSPQCSSAVRHGAPTQWITHAVDHSRGATRSLKQSTTVVTVNYILDALVHAREHAGEGPPLVRGRVGVAIAGRHLRRRVHTLRKYVEVAEGGGEEAARVSC